MKTAIVFAGGIKQIMFTPENDDEKQALRLITPDDNIELAIHHGGFGEANFKPFTASINKCRGGFLRVFSDQETTMLVLTPKEVMEEINKDSYSLDDMKRCFEESRFTHPMTGFKHTDFEEFISSIKKA